MKKIIYLFSLIALCACNRPRTTALENLKLNGPVKSVTTNTYEEAEKLFGEWEPLGKSTETNVFTFDKKGLLSTWNRYTGENLTDTFTATLGKEKIKYRGEWIESRSVQNSDSKYEEVTEFANDLPHKTVIKINDTIQHVLVYSNVADIKSYTVTRYHANGKDIIEKRIIKDGNIIAVGEGEIYNTAYIEYNDKGNPIKSTNARLTSMNEVSSGLYGHHNTTTHSYTFDNWGNWIKRVDIKEFQYLDPDIDVVTRDIQYY